MLPMCARLLWLMPISAAGVTSFAAPRQAEILRLGGADIKLQYIELFDDNIGPKG